MVDIFHKMNKDEFVVSIKDDDFTVLQICKSLCELFLDENDYNDLYTSDVLEHFVFKSFYC